MTRKLLLMIPNDIFNEAVTADLQEGHGMQLSKTTKSNSLMCKDD